MSLNATVRALLAGAISPTNRPLRIPAAFPDGMGFVFQMRPFHASVSRRSSQRAPVGRPDASQGMSRPNLQRKPSTERQNFRISPGVSLATSSNSTGMTQPPLTMCIANSIIERTFHTSQSNEKDFQFDTFRLVKDLEAQGFTKQQSEALMQLFGDIVDEAVNGLRRYMVTMEDQEKNWHKQKVDFANLRTDLMLLERNDFSMIRDASDRMVSELEKLRNRFKNDIAKSQADVRLDLNLEKSRIREVASAHELKIKETDTRIDTEINNLKAFMHQSRQSTWQYLGGLLATLAGLYLAYLRFIS